MGGNKKAILPEPIGIRPVRGPESGGAPHLRVMRLSATREPATPQRCHRVRRDGRLISTRRMGNQLDRVPRDTPDVPEYEPVPVDRVAEKPNGEILAAATPGHLLPRMAVNGADIGALVASEWCLLPPPGADAIPEPGLITVTALNLANPQNRTVQSVAGGGDTLDMWPGSLFGAMPRPPLLLPLENDPAADAIEPDIPQESTAIYKFRRTPKGPVYAGSGVVPGHFGGVYGCSPIFVMDFLRRPGFLGHWAIVGFHF